MPTDEETSRIRGFVAFRGADERGSPQKASQQSGKSTALQDRGPEVSRHRRGTGTIFTAGSKTLWIRYFVKGRPVTENAHTTDHKIAGSLLEGRITDVTRGLTPEPAAMRKLTVANLYETLEREYQINGRRSLDDLKTRWKLHVGPVFRVHGPRQCFDGPSVPIRGQEAAGRRQQCPDQPRIGATETRVSSWAAMYPAESAERPILPDAEREQHSARAF
jgi:hypothetical protein